MPRIRRILIATYPENTVFLHRSGQQYSAERFQALCNTRLVLNAGAARVDAAVTHCLAGQKGLARLHDAGISRLIASDTVPGPCGIVQTADILAEAIRKGGLLDA